MPPLSYLLTFSTYGTHLPGAGKGWVDEQHCIPGSPMRASNPRRLVWWRAQLNEAPWTLSVEARHITRDAIHSVCMYRRWIVHAIHVRTNHVHAIIAGEIAPERILSDCKAYATRELRRAFPGIQRRRYWANHGSTRYLWNEASLQAAIEYVLRGQGEPMACYPNALETEPEA